jgi:5-formyltetrahydrofolate cyclo-ligase
MMDKITLRGVLMQKRAEFSREERKGMDRDIAAGIIDSPLFKNASMLLIYAPLESEINLLPLAHVARKRGLAIAFPRCDKETNTMQFYILPEGQKLTPGAYGIPEPPEDAEVCIPDERALCIVPALSYDLSGNRIGYGKGYYDRYLATFPGVKIGATYAAMLLKSVPTEAHDLPVDWLFTERGAYHCKETAEAKHKPEQKRAPLTDAPKEDKSSPKWQQIYSRLMNGSARLGGGKDGVTKPLHAPLLLVLCNFVLLLLSRLIDARLLDRDSEYVGVILIQVLIFIIPAILYCKLRGESFSERIRLRPPKISHLPFLLYMLVVMIAGSLLASILTGGIRSLEGNFTLYDTFIARTGTPAETAYAILAYAFLPAIGEELTYRSILCSEYEKRGVGVAIAASALLFSMLHFSFAHFLTYLVLGALLACAMYTTRSFLAPILLHICYNVFCLFGQPYLSAFYVNAGSNEIFIFCVVVLFLLFSAFAAGEARKIYHIHAKKNISSAYTQALPWRRLPATLLETLLSPVAAVCLVIWLITSIATLN